MRFWLAFIIHFSYCAKVSFFLLQRLVVQYVFTLGSINVWNTLLLLRKILLSLKILALTSVFDGLVDQSIYSSAGWVSKRWNKTILRVSAVCITHFCVRSFFLFLINQISLHHVLYFSYALLRFRDLIILYYINLFI